MKHFITTLLLVFLCLSLFMSCSGEASTDADAEASGIVQSSKENNKPSDKLTKEEKLKRMNDAHNAKNRGTTAKTNDMVEAKINSTTSNKIGSDQAEQSSRNMRRRYEEVMNKPASEKQKLIADNICKCLNKNPLFDTVKNVKNSKDVLNLAGDDKDKEVKDLQDCYNKNMVPAVNDLGQDAGVFAMKSRTHLNKNCLDGTDNFWISIGGYLSRNSDEGTIEINMPEIEKGLLKNQ